MGAIGGVVPAQAIAITGRMSRGGGVCGRPHCADESVAGVVYRAMRGRPGAGFPGCGRAVDGIALALQALFVQAWDVGRLVAAWRRAVADVQRCCCPVWVRALSRLGARRGSSCGEPCDDPVRATGKQRCGQTAERNPCNSGDVFPSPFLSLSGIWRNVEA